MASSRIASQVTLISTTGQTNDLINQIPVPAGTNLTNQIVTNVGDLENRGLEFSINAKAVATTNIDWELGFNASYNANKITKLTAVDDPTYKGILCWRNFRWGWKYHTDTQCWIPLIFILRPGTGI